MVRNYGKIASGIKNQVLLLVSQIFKNLRNQSQHLISYFARNFSAISCHGNKPLHHHLSTTYQRIGVSVK